MSDNYFQKNKFRFFVSGLLGALAVALGALGAHALKNQIPGGLITSEQVAGFDTGSKYQMYHSIAMIMVLIIGERYDNKFLRLSYLFFLIGILLFSGSLYFLTTRNLIGLPGLSVLGPITPIGGLFFMAGWVLFALSFFKKS